MRRPRARIYSPSSIEGPHGAGLSNSVTAWPGTVVVEFIPEAGLSNLVYMQESQGVTIFSKQTHTLRPDSPFIATVILATGT